MLTNKELIELSAKHNIYIVCKNIEKAQLLQTEAAANGIGIPFPLCYWEFAENRYYGAGVKGFIFDDPVEYIRSLTTVQIHNKS